MVERTCKTCIFFVPSQLDPHIGRCMSEVWGPEVGADDRCPNYWPKPGAELPVGGRLKGEERQMPNSNQLQRRVGYKRFAKLLRLAGTAAWVLAGLVNLALCAFIVWARGMDIVAVLFFAPWTLALAPFYEIAGYGNWRPLIVIVALSVGGVLAGKFCNWLAEGLEVSEQGYTIARREELL